MVHRGTVVLVVEDDPVLRQLYRASLTIEGYAVVAVEDGVDALRVLDGSTPPSAVILDLNLPRLTGHAVLSELRAHPETADIPVIVVTGQPETIDKTVAACVLTKPIDVADLIESVEKCLRDAKAARPTDPT
jgi:CheY-like chemotaxis protein